jgi:hypothetical protein
MKRVIASVFAGMVLMASASFAAGEKDRRIQQRKENQQKRIVQGVKSGSLTPRETARIERQETTLNKEIRHDRKDGGKLTRSEKAKINRQQNRLSREIHNQKHDGQDRK